MAKLLKLRRGTTTQHGSFTGAEGEVTIDTVKDTAVVHDGSNAGGHPLAKENMANVSSASIAGRLADDAINPSKIAGGTLGSDVKVTDSNVSGNLTIEDADIVANANIAGSKLENSGVTAGQYGSSSAIPIVTVDAQGLVTAASTTAIDSTTIANGTSNVAVANNANITITRGDQMIVNVSGGGIGITGDMSITGNVDGVDVAALKTSKDSLSTTNGTILGSAILANGVTATTQSAGDASTKVATTAYTDTAISNLVDSSPGALNTLNELAAAVNDDANFSTTITNSIATKMPLAGGEFTGNVTCENITPDADSSRNLGSNSTRFSNVYADNFVGSGANLTGIVSFVSGMIIIWSGAENAIPSGWVICDGNNSTPNLRARFVLGGGSGSGYSINDTGGSASVTLTSNQIPSHSHTTNNHTHSFNAGSHTHSFSGSGSSSHSHSYSVFTPGGWGNNTGYTQRMHNRYPTGYNTGSATVSLSVSGNTGNAGVAGNTGNSNPSTNNTGGGGSHENRPPYYVLCYIMKT